MVSSRSLASGLKVIISAVRQFPPNASCKIFVNFDSLNGICTFCLLLSANPFIHLPRVDKDELIAIASSRLSPDTSDFLILSEPAKSTRNSVEACPVNSLVSLN